MKSNELMLGDWILAAGKPIRVTFATLSICDNVNFKPVPLTPEILEKNEFHAYSDVSQEWFIGVFRDGNKYLELTYSKGDIDWTINGDEYCIAPIKYVHELQHALKLCGIKKEIVL